MDYQVDFPSDVGAEDAYLDKLVSLKKGLMNDLLTGKVRVNVLEEVNV